MRLLPVGPDHGRGRAAQEEPVADRCRHQRGDDQYLPLRHVSTHSQGRASRGRHESVREGSAMTIMPKISRRGFIVSSAAAGSGFALGFHLPGKGANAATAPMPKGGEVNAWIMINPDETVTLRVHRSEMGQGSYTALPQMIAEELECDWSKVRPEFANATRQITQNKVYVSMGTGGSRAIRDSQAYVRKAGATAREILVQAGAQSWKVPAGECYAEKGFVVHKPSGKKLSYGTLASAAATIAPPQDVKIKPASEWKIIG